MRLILVRHGETWANRMRINQGARQGQLTSKGIRQARKTADLLANEEIDFIYCSDLKRAKDTSAEIRKKVKAEFRIAEEIRERNLGVFEEKPYGTFKKYVESKGLDLLRYRPKGGESIMEADRRARAFLKKCLKEHQGETVLWVSHGSVLKRILVHALEKYAVSFEKLHPGNCAVSLIEFHPDKTTEVALLNYNEHIPEEDRTPVYNPQKRIAKANRRNHSRTRKSTSKNSHIRTKPRAKGVRRKR